MKFIYSGLIEDAYCHIKLETSRMRDEKFVQLLKKIAKIEIEDFSSHIVEEIKNTWETWNSPRLSLNSLYLDEIEEMNLYNIQEG
ncbi:hypothetical protein Gotur_017197 [Gossypium turneri]